MSHRLSSFAALLVLAALGLPACSGSGTSGGGAGTGADAGLGGGASDPGNGSTAAGGAADGAEVAAGKSGALFYQSASRLIRRDLASGQEISVKLPSSSSDYLGFGGGVFTEYVNGYPDLYNYDITLHQFDGSTFTARSLPTLEVPHGRVTSMVQPSPDATRFLLATSENEGLGTPDVDYVRVIDASLRVIKKIEGYRAPIWIDSHTLAMEAGDRIHVHDLDRNATKTFGPAMGKAVTDLALSPDGTTLAFVVDNAVYRMGLDGVPIQLTLQSVEQRWPTWSPDGSTIIVQYGVCSYTYQARAFVVSATLEKQDIARASWVGVSACGPMRWM